MAHKFKLVSTIFIAIAFAFLVGAFGGQAIAQEGQLARGGKLYDKWFKVIGVDKPTSTHKAWPASNTKKKGNATWRCKACHGWDGLGKNGAYAKGSYKTGIKGVDAYWGADPAKIVAIMKDSTHGLAGKMDDEDFQDLALFVSKGMVDLRKYIDYASKMPKAGDQARGKNYFNTICVGCHREDGRRPKDMDKPLGKQMGNPWEVMHKIMNGHPGEPMPALRALANREQIAMDIMAHVKTLPKEK